MIFVIGFISEEPPKTGELPYDPSHLHITYLNYALLTQKQTGEFLESMEHLTSTQRPLSVKLEDSYRLFGPESNIPVLPVVESHRESHAQLNKALETAVLSVEGIIAPTSYDYTPHVSYAPAPFQTEIKHLSVIHHDGQVGRNTRNLANFRFR